MDTRIYLDNSATSFPKPRSVMGAMADFAAHCGASAGRGAYAEARACQDILTNCRRKIARLINAESPERIVFTLNCSDALNIVIRGLLNTAPAPSHALATAMEHNSVLRPYHALMDQTHLEADFVPCDGTTGLVDPDDVRRAIKPYTRLISCVHVSNVTGTIQPVDEIARIARRCGIPLLVDAAQSAGHLEIDVQKLGADFVAFPGHKGLLGPLGTGILYISPGMDRLLKTTKEGGTGTVSELPVQPEDMPDKFEIGSHNAIGLAGLSAGVDWVLQRGVSSIRSQELELSRTFMSELTGVAGLKIYGPTIPDMRAGIFSVTIEGQSPIELACELEESYGILTRPGLHCAPFAHRTIGTYPQGTCRLSFGPMTTDDQVCQARRALVSIARRIPAGK